MGEELTPEQMLESVKTESAPTEVAAAEPQAPWWKEKSAEEIEYVVEGGKLVKEPLEMALRRAGMGYNYAQKAHQLSQQEARFKEIEAQNAELQRWKEYDEFAHTNPEWAQHVQETWNNRQNLGQSNQQPNPEFEAIRKELAELREFKTEFTTARELEQQQSEDKQFISEIQTVAKQFGVDMDQADENGRTLQWRVLEHMQKLGLNGTKPGHFAAAFKDYNFDNLVGRQKEQAIEQRAKDHVELKRAGIKNVSRTPSKNDSLNGYRPGMSSTELREEALKFFQNFKS